jgi:hypothetical protein
MIKMENEEDIVKDLAKRIVETCYGYLVSQNLEDQEKIDVSVGALIHALGCLVGLSVKKEHRSKMIESFVQDIITYCELIDEKLGKNGH